jgi:hypothetical protein
MLKAECPRDDRFENAAPVTQAILVNKAHVPISWPKPADVLSGTVLGPAQLDATSTIPGQFVYTPPEGTVVHRTENMPLSVQFIPDDSANFATEAKSTSINVLNGTPKFESPPSLSDTTIFGAPISFAAQASDSDNDPLTYQWDFGDGSTGTGAAADHIYSAPGIYSAKVTVSDGLGGVETSIITVQVNRGMTVQKGSVKLNFQKLNTDAITISGTLQIPSLFAGNKPARVHIGGVNQDVTLDAKGKAKTGTLSLSVSAAKAGVSKFSISLAKSSFLLETMGFVNATLKNAPAHLPLLFSIGDDTYQASIPMLYTATKSKKGAGKYTAHK